MLKKLRYKFVGFTVLLFGVIVMSVIGIFNYAGYQDMHTQVRYALENTLASQQELEREFGRTERDDHVSERIRTFKIEKSGTVTSRVFVSIDTNFLANLVEQATQSEGSVSQRGYTFHYLADDTGIAFADVTQEWQQIQQTFVVSLVIGVIALVGVFISSTLLANWALKPVEESWRKQKEFISDASHELRTPIAVILANTALLQDTPNDTIVTKMKWIHYIQDEARRMKELVERLLFLAKSDQSKQPIILETVNMSQILQGVVLPLESVAFEKNKTIDMHVADDVMVMGQATYLKQLFVILLDNALKYGADNDTIVIQLDKRAHFTIQNTGEPIPLDKQARLFERFYRIDDARARESEGYGLGLAIAQTIAQMHQTHIQVTSTKKDGTCFSVQFKKV